MVLISEATIKSRHANRARKKIAILLYWLNYGGIERLHLHLAQEWLARGIDVEFVLCRASGGLIDLVPPGAVITDLNVTKAYNAVWPLSRYLRRSRANALLAAHFPLTVVAPLAARIARFPGKVVVSEHAVMSKAHAKHSALHWLLRGPSMRAGYPLADHRLGVSRGVADSMAAFSGLPRDRFEVISNPAATGVMHHGSSQPAPLVPLSKPTIIAVGRLAPEKRFDVLLEAFAELLRDREASLCILGEGPERTALQRQIEQRGLRGRVILPGWVSDVGPWYAHSDLFVLSSEQEGFGNVIVEALEQGVPVVSTDCPTGPREILENERYGKLVPVGDASALARAMFHALTESHDRHALQRRAKDFVVNKIADEYLNKLMPGYQA